MSGNAWQESKFDGSEAEPDPSGLSSRVFLRSIAGLVTLASLVLYFESRSRVSFRCRQECYGTPPRSVDGSLTFEPGHPWTNYADSWQWSAQHGLTQLAVVAALVGLAMAATPRRNPLPALGVATLGLAAWAVWVLLGPPIP